MSYTNWRDDPGLQPQTQYKKKFAFFPVACTDGTKVWFKHYYKKYMMWGRDFSGINNGDYHYHVDLIECITEAEFIVRRLSEKL